MSDKLLRAGANLADPAAALDLMAKLPTCFSRRERKHRADLLAFMVRCVIANIHLKIMDQEFRLPFANLGGLEMTFV